MMRQEHGFHNKHNPKGVPENLNRGGKKPACDRWWTIPRNWEGETVFIIAGGPSLIGFDLDPIRDRGRVIAINVSYQLYPEADLLYFCDRSWWSAFGKDVKRSFAGQILTMDNPRIEGVHSVRKGPQLGLSDKPDTLCHGSNSGYQAINAAFLFGAKRIVLLGYDMHTDEFGRTHFHVGYGISANAYERRCKLGFLPTFPYLKEPLEKAGVEVINCTPGSHLTVFPRRPLKFVLRKMAQESHMGEPLTRNGGLYVL